MSIFSDSNINPAIDGSASPVVIRIYQLKKSTKFNNSDFFSLYEHDNVLLARDLQSKTELEIQPNEKYRKTLEIKPNTHYLAVLAAFRDLDHAQWKKIKRFDQQKNQSIVINLKQNNIELEVK